MQRGSVVGACIIAAVVVTSPLHLPLNNPNEGVRVFTAKALVEHGTFAIDDVVAQWGYIDDKAKKDGKLYSSKAPLVSMLGALAYATVHPVTGDLSRIALTRLCRAASAIPVLLSVLLCLWALRQRMGGDDDDELNADLAVCTLIIGSGVLASLHVLAGHALAACSTAAAVAIWRCCRDMRTWAVAAASALLMLATTAEYPAALSLPLVLLVVSRARHRQRAIIAAVVAAVVAAIPTLYAHTAMWGAPWRTGYSYLESPHYRPLVEGTLFGIGTPNGTALVTSFFSPELGLFFYTPLLVLGVIGLAMVARDVSRKGAIVIAVVVVGYVAFIGGFRGWRGGWSVGPRYILELVGVFAVLAIDGARVIPAAVRGGVVAALAAVGVVHSGLAGAFFPHLPDILRAPIGELVLPLIWRGFTPDGVLLLLGVPTSIAALITAAIVLAPVVVIPFAHARLGVAAVALVVVVVTCVLHVALVVPDAKAAREVQRITGTWRPLHGVP